MTLDCRLGLNYRRSFGGAVWPLCSDAGLVTYWFICVDWMCLSAHGWSPATSLNAGRRVARWRVGICSFLRSRWYECLMVNFKLFLRVYKINVSMWPRFQIADDCSLGSLWTRIGTWRPEECSWFSVVGYVERLPTLQDGFDIDKNVWQNT